MVIGKQKNKKKKKTKDAAFVHEIFASIPMDISYKSTTLVMYNELESTKQNSKMPTLQFFFF